MRERAMPDAVARPADGWRSQPPTMSERMYRTLRS